jgi:transposase
MVIGIDVAKAELVVAARPGGERWTAANDERGVRALVERLRRESPELVVLEATGGYELLCVAALVAAALPVVVANPRQVRDFARDFARATGELAKTDRVDAGVLALFAERVRPRCARCRAGTRRSSTRCSRGGASCSRCSARSGTGWARPSAAAAGR